MKAVPLAARSRTEKGTRACRKLRQSGEIPANLYGAKQVDGKTQHENVPLAVSAYDVMQLIQRHQTVAEVSFGGRKELVQINEIQRDAFGDNVVHLDLHMIDVNKPIWGEVELVFKGDAKGVKSGGRLLVEMHALEVECLPANMPKEILVRVDDLDMHQGLHVRELTLPEGVTAVSPADLLVVHVAPQGSDEVAALPTEGAAAEPEVISKGKKEEEAEG